MIAVQTALRVRRGIAPLLESEPSVMLQALVVPGEKTTEGQIIEAVTIPWFAIIDLMLRDPQVIYQIDWRKWEEIIAGAYKQHGREYTDIVDVPIVSAQPSFTQCTRPG